MIEWFILLSLAIILVFLLILTIQGSKIPKHIWTYWDTTEIPEMVQKCLSTWKKNNPDYEITILNRENLSTYIPDVDIFNLKFADSPARISDFIRLYVLSKYGGIWIDASSIVPKSLNWISDLGSQIDYIGYYKESNTTMEHHKSIESWFFACPPRSNFVSKWRDEFMRMNDYNSISDYVKSVQDEGVNLQNIGDYEYLTIYVACQRVLQKLMTVDEIKRSLYLIRQEDHQTHMHGNLDVLCTDKRPNAPVIKFTRFERQEIESKKMNCIFDNYV
jgi:hypothetical protein